MPSGSSTSGAHGPERDDNIAGVDRPDVGLDPPVCVGAVQRARVAGQHHAAERGKARGIGARHRQRIGDARRAGPVHGVAENAARAPARARSAASRSSGTIRNAEARGQLELAA